MDRKREGKEERRTRHEEEWETEKEKTPDIENHPLFMSATTGFGDYYSLVVSIIDISSM